MTKIRHADSDNEGALSCWSAATEAIGKYHMAIDRSTRIIVLSICDTLGRSGQTWSADVSLDELEKPGVTQYWIAGMRHWLEYMQYRGRYSRMQLVCSSSISKEQKKSIYERGVMSFSLDMCMSKQSRAAPIAIIVKTMQRDMDGGVLKTIRL